MPAKVWLARVAPALLRAVRSQAEPYWRDVGTLEETLEGEHGFSLGDAPELDMYDQNWPIRTHMESLPPAEIRAGPLR